MRPLLLILASGLAIAAASGPAASNAEEGAGDGLPGTYECAGTRPDGTQYRGIVEIARHNGTYRLLWTLSAEEQYLGIGILTGNVLAVSYSGLLPGVIAYRIERGADGLHLAGQWSVLDADGRVFSETLKRLTPSPQREAPSAPPVPPAPRPLPFVGSRV